MNYQYLEKYKLRPFKLNYFVRIFFLERRDSLEATIFGFQHLERVHAYRHLRDNKQTKFEPIFEVERFFLLFK